MDSDVAPIYEVPDCEVVAVEHPMMIRSIDNAIKTFGKNSPFIRVAESSDPEQCIPLWLRFNDPMCVPILSHNSPTNNILLKFTIPKRTGRKRKRGSNGPFTFPDGEASNEANEGRAVGLLGHKNSEMVSQLGKDNPATLFRKINDNIDTYQVEAVAEIRQTHRYRGLSDFHHSTSNTEFGEKLMGLVDGDINKIKEFKLNPARGWKSHEEFMPAPKMTVHTIPQNWAWRQNGNIHQRTDQKTGKQILVNHSKPRKFEIPYLGFDERPVPMESPFEIPDDVNLQELITELQQAFIERPIWSRRALFNHLSFSKQRHLMKAAIQHAGYQFRGGPFRECVIRYGIDPRTDPQYRKYQSIFFKVYEDQRNSGMQWHDMRTTYSLTKKGAAMGPTNGHIFDGKKVTLDGKVWQLCDITDLLLANLIDTSPCTKTFELKSDGWYHNGSMAKIRGIMRTKIMCIWRKKEITDNDFKDALLVPDNLPGRKSTQVYVPLPDDGMTAEEFAKLDQRGIATIVEDSEGDRRRIHKGKQRQARIRAKVGTKKQQERVRKRKVHLGTTGNAPSTENGVQDIQVSGAEPSTGSATEPNLTTGGSLGVNENGDWIEGPEPDFDSAEDDDDDDDQGGIEFDDDDDDDDDDDEVEEEEDDDEEEGLENIAAPVLKSTSQANTASTGDTSSRATPHASTEATSSRATPHVSEPPTKKARTSKAPTEKKATTPKPKKDATPKPKNDPKPKKDAATNEDGTPKPKKVYKPRAKKAATEGGGSASSSRREPYREPYVPIPLDMSQFRNIAPRPPPPS